MGTVIIRAPGISVEKQVARVAAEVVFSGEKRLVWFDCDAAHADKLSWEACDGFLVAMLAVAMRAGDDIVVEGPLSSRLHYNLTSYYVELVRNLVPGTRTISIQASHLTRKHRGGNGVFTGFSAGIDSFCTILEHRAGRVPAEYQVTHLLFNNVGSHGQSESTQKIFQEKYARLERHSTSLDLPLIKVDSNLDSIMRLNFQQTHTLRNVAVALMFQKSCAKYLYPSTLHYRDVRVERTHDIAYADSIGVGLLSTETTECISSGGQYTRFRKTEIISSEPVTYEALDICVAGEVAVLAGRTNCSQCWKCARTLLSLEIIGALPRYERCFNLDTYRKFRWLCICNVLGNPLPLFREVKEAIDRYNFPVPWSARIVARIVPNRIIDLTYTVWDWALTDNPFLILWRATRHVLRHGFKRA